VFEEIRSRLSGLSSDLAKAQAQMAQAERDLALAVKLYEIVAALEPIHGLMTIDGSGQVNIEVRDAEDELLWWQYFMLPAMPAVDTTRWPSPEKIVRRWEAAQPTPRAGNPWDRSTWSYPGRLIPTEWNGRKANEID